VWFQKVVAKGGAVTLDMGPNMDPKLGPIGAIAKEQVEQFQAIAQQDNRQIESGSPQEQPNKPEAGDGK